MSVSEEQIITQTIHARHLVSCLSSDSLNHIDLLDSLAQAGLKLEKINESDCDDEGLSIASKAYMFSIIEQIQNSHYNSKDTDQFEDYYDDEDTDISIDDDSDFFEGD